jgi:hypothetical protein
MSLIKKATDVHLTFLRNSGASFKVILADGEVIVHDPNNLIDPKKPEGKFKRGESRNPGVKHGEPTKYVMPLIKDLEPGQLVSIPNKYHIDTMRSVVCNHARRLWGEGSYMASISDDKLTISLLRVK